MYFLRYLEKELSLHPSNFGKDVYKMLKKQLYDEEEGTCNGDFFTVAIMDIHDTSPGIVKLGQGLAEFKMRYRAIIFKPFKGETLDCSVDRVSQHGIFAEAGPMKVFVAHTHTPKNMKFNPEATPPNMISNDGEVIEKGSAIRVVIIGIRSDVASISSVAKMSESWLGLVGEV